MSAANIIRTMTANCQDCYRCVRNCSVKAISIYNHQAKIIDGLCIRCGTCVLECPQNAKTFRSDLDEVKNLIRSGRKVAASVAPAFAAAYGGSLSNRLPSVLRQLGFNLVSETAEGAKYVTEQSFGSKATGNICTACPVVVNYIEKHVSFLKDSLIPVVSPMIAHGRLLKARYKDCAVVFIGPCAAKKEEAARPENEGAIDNALTFIELEAWMAEESISIENGVESGFDRVYHVGDARLFPLEGGMLFAGGMDSGTIDMMRVKVSGEKDVMDLLNDRITLLAVDAVEALFCKGGCIDGPAMPKAKTYFERRRDLLAYWEKTKGLETPVSAVDINNQAVFTDKKRHEEPINESIINKILEKMGKVSHEQRLNCMACGYKSCVENAYAVAKGMAEIEMCTPYMRRLAYQRTDRIIDTTPNGVVILDKNLNMIQMNPAFQKMFMCNNSILGRHISYLVNAQGFELIQSGKQEKYESVQSKYSIRYHEILYALRDEEQYVGIYSDTSRVKFETAQLDLLKNQTLTHAKEFLDHQIRFAQEMGHYLGRSTAQSEDIARKLIELFESTEVPE